MQTNHSRVQVLNMILTHEQVNLLSKQARKHHLSATKILARGTLASGFFQMLGITSDRRELVSILMSSKDAGEFIDLVYEKLQMDKPGHGIAYLIDVLACIGTHNGTKITLEETASLNPEGSMYHKITVVVERGNAEDVMDAAREAGARGGTILHGRGSTGKEAQTIFGIEIEPEKEIVLILTPVDITQRVFDAIAQKMDIDAPGNGIMYVEPIATTRGLFESTQQ